jgi:transglutaminase/protease-like cytokinesis protein 3
MNAKHIESKDIADQIKRFLEDGGTIEPIKTGIGKQNPMRTAHDAKCQANGAKARRGSRWHGPSKDGLSKRWNDGKSGII